MDSASSKFHVADYVVFGLSLAIAAAVGFYFACTGGKQKTSDEFLMANRKMNFFPVALSLMASFMSSITILGTPSEIYTYGMMYVWYCFSFIGSSVFAAHLYLPVFYKLRLTSVYEYLELRFNRGIRMIGAFLFTIQTLLYMSVVLYGPSLALNAVTGLNVWISVVLVGLVCTIYTALGGLKAVIWTDVFQTVVMLAGLIAVIVQGTIAAGGFQNVIDIAYNSGRIDFYNSTKMFNPDPTVRHTFWTLGLGGTLIWTSVFSVNQSAVQRALSIPKLKNAQISIWLTFPLMSLIIIMSAICGLVMYARYVDCDPKSTGQVLFNDQLVPFFVLDILSFLPGVPGLFIACVFSGALSTISSGLNSLAAVALIDIVKVYCKPNLTEKKGALVSKVIAALYGVLCVGIAAIFLVVRVGSIVRITLTIFSLIGGPLLGMFSLGILFPWANWKGVLVGVLCSYGLTFWMSFGAITYPNFSPKYPVSTIGCPVDSNMTDAITTTIANWTTTMATTPVPIERPAVSALYTLSYLWVGVVGWLVVVVVGLIFSFLTGYTKSDEVDPRLIAPIVYRCLPKRNEYNKKDDQLTGKSGHLQTRGNKMKESQAYDNPNLSTHL